MGKLLLILDHDGWSDRHQLLWLLYSKEKKKIGELAEWCALMFLEIKLSYLLVGDDALRAVVWFVRVVRRLSVRSS